MAADREGRRTAVSLLSAVRVFALALCCAGTVAGAAVDPAELLDPEQAFKISVRAIDERSAEVEFKIADGYYMYRDRFQFATELGLPLADVQIPPGKVKKDPFFGESQVFRDLVRIRVPVSPEEAHTGLLKLKVTSQGCSDSGVCYVPLEQVVKVRLAGAPSGLQGIAVPSISRWRDDIPSVPWAALAASLAAGLALGWAALGARPGRPYPLNAGAFGRGLAKGAAWAAAGGVAAWLGSMVEGRSDNPWIALSLALACLGFAIAWMAQSHPPAAHGAGMPPAEKALLAVPLLLLAAFVGQVWLGIGALLGLGMLLSARPREGALTGPVRQWSVQMTALALLAASVWIAAPLLPEPLGMAAWAALFLMIATICRAIDPLPHAAPAALRLAKALGFGFLLWGVAVAIGAASGARDPLHPFAALSAGSPAPAAGEIRFERVSTLQELEHRVASAGQPVMLDFYADWCVSCKEMERFTFSSPKVRARMQRMLLLQTDVTRNTEDDKAMLKRFRLFGPPGIVFFDARGQELHGLRVIGFQPANRFAQVLDIVLERAGGDAPP